MISSSSRPTNPRLALLVIAVVFAILNADITTVNVALVTLGKDLHADLADLQWGLNSYMLAFAALIVAAGRVADVFGRRRCLLAGAILFAVASLLCGIASTLSVLVIGRVLQGAAGALMVPAGMAIISNAYGGEQRALALGTLVGVSGVAQSMGPLLGGFLTAEVSWRWVFLMNLPLVAVIMIIAVRSIQESHAENALHRIDITGVFILAAALTSLLLGLNAAQDPDKDQVVTLGLIALSLVLFVSGLAILSFMPASCGYIGMVFPFLLVAAGVGPGFTLLNTAGLAAIPSERSGQATGMIYMFRFAGGAIGVSAASALHRALFHRQLVFRLSETLLSFAQQKLLEQPGAAERIRQIDSGLVASQVEQVRQAFYESFVAAFTGTLRLNVIMPIAIAILAMMLLGKKEGTKQTSSMDAGATAHL